MKLSRIVDSILSGRSNLLILPWLAWRVLSAHKENSRDSASSSLLLGGGSLQPQQTRVKAAVAFSLFSSTVFLNHLEQYFKIENASRQR